jgi:hypothetical protein
LKASKQRELALTQVEDQREKRSSSSSSKITKQREMAAPRSRNIKNE